MAISAFVEIADTESKEKQHETKTNRKEAVKSINIHEIELGIEKREKTRIQKDLVACQNDLAKLEVIEQGSE